MRRWGSAGVLIAVLVCGTGLAGCTTVRNCGRDLSTGLEVTVVVKSWVTEHPETNVRVCVGGACTVGFNEITVDGAMPSTPLERGSTVEVEADAVSGSTVVRTMRTTASVSPGGCGQWVARLTLTADGDLRQ
ncbi:hypothetical protein [Leifsonia aquatica]|uniref:hypothetical protein n=1 Tax=Leifsonia aquatica TaxID=144185 RepID=UPI0028AF0CC7|nr:hypothetical protein [Leifsonia aquatica]